MPFDVEEAHCREAFHSSVSFVWVAQRRTQALPHHCPIQSGKAESGNIMIHSLQPIGMSVTHFMKNLMPGFLDRVEVGSIPVQQDGQQNCSVTLTQILLDLNQLCSISVSHRASISVSHRGSDQDRAKQGGAGCCTRPKWLQVTYASYIT